MAIKIEKNLEKFSTLDPTKESKPISLANLCKDIESGKITLPIFQTYIRWTKKKSIDLLNFQLKGKAAVSPISINVIENIDLAVPQVSFIDRIPVSFEELQGKQSVNDGQQRLSCNYKAYMNHPEFENIVLDLVRGKFLEILGPIKKHQIPVGILYNKEHNVYKEYLKNNKALQEFEVSSLLGTIRNKFMGYYYTVNYAKDLTETEQRSWFEVLNLAGSKLTEVEVHLTKMLIKGVDFYKEYAIKFSEKIDEFGFENLFRYKATEVSIPLASLNPAYEVLTNKSHKINFSPMPSDTKASYLSALTQAELRELFEMSLKSLERALHFLVDNGLGVPSRIDYLTYLIGAFTFVDDKELNDKQREFILNWYKTVEFSKKDNGERRKIFSDFIKVKDLK